MHMQKEHLCATDPSILAINFCVRELQGTCACTVGWLKELVPTIAMLYVGSSGSLELNPNIIIL